MELRCRERPAEPQSVRSRERSQHDKERHYQKQQFGGILAIRRRESAVRTFAGNSSVTASLAIVSNTATAFFVDFGGTRKMIPLGGSGRPTLVTSTSLTEGAVAIFIVCGGVGRSMCGVAWVGG